MAKRKRRTQRQGARRRSPKIKFKDDGSVDYIECPFCDTSHAIIVGNPAFCGTHLEMVAVQHTIKDKGLTCARCGEKGGTLVKVGESLYAHDYMCSNKTLETQLPKRYSFTAKIAHGLLSDNAMVWVYNKLGIYPFEYLKVVDGVVTDEPAGYVWRKKE